MNILAGLQHVLLMVTTMTPAMAAPVPVDEVLHGIRFTEKAVVIELVSTGCTRPEHFRLIANDQNAEQTGLLIQRVVPDRCRKAPKRITLRLPRTDSWKKPVYVLNPFSPE